MQSCCIRFCDSYKETPSKYIGYFKFPLNDVHLLKKWLRQIDRPGWEPSERSQICSEHFRESDFEPLSWPRLRLLPYSVPTIFPFDALKVAMRKRRIEEEQMADVRKEIIPFEAKNRTRRRRRIDEELVGDGKKEIIEELVEPHRNKVSLLRRKVKPVINNAADQLGGNVHLKKKQNVEEKKESVVVSPVEMVATGTLKRDKPFLRITINKKVNVPTSSYNKPEPFETIYLPYHEGKEENSEIVKVEDNRGLICPEERSSEFSQIDDIEIVKIEDTRSSELLKQSSPIEDMEIVKVNKAPTSSRLLKQYTRKSSRTIQTQDHRYSCDIRGNKSKLQKDSKDLGKRLDELRERREQEQLKIKRLQMDLLEVEKKMKENNSEEIVVPNLGRGSKFAGSNKSSWLLREKEEYENLLKDVREIKLKVLRERHDRELYKIRRLQTQMINLGKKMRENDEKEIALANLRASSNSAAARPDWMKREEEEYEKLLEDVRKLKEIYRLRRKPKDDDFIPKETTASPEKEKIISDEDCIIIETMQENNISVDGGGSANDIYIVDDDNEYGEVIGEIDDDSIDIDMSNEATIDSFNDELPDPGLLDA